MRDERKDKAMKGMAGREGQSDRCRSTAIEKLYVGKALLSYIQVHGMQ